MDKLIQDIARKFFNLNYETLTQQEKEIIQHLAKHLRISKDINIEFEEHLSLGQQLANRMAAFCGSWRFIFVFLLVMVLWMALNSYLLVRMDRAFDPYPYIFLNLFLSMLGSILAPIIMMSQNRQAEKDRLEAAHNYEVNLKAELEIMSLHEKIDTLQEKHLKAIVKKQQEQSEVLKKIMLKKRGR